MRIPRKVLAVCVALAVCVGVAAGYWDLSAYGADPAPIDGWIDSLNVKNSSVATLTKNRNYVIEFQYYEEATKHSFANGASGNLLDADLRILPSYPYGTGSQRVYSGFTGSATLSSLKVDNVTNGVALIKGTIDGVKYTNTNYTDLVFQISNARLGTTGYSSSSAIVLSAAEYAGGSGGSGGSGSDFDVDTYNSDIVVENVLVRDSNGELLERVDEDSPPFTIEVLFYDLGFEGVHNDDFYGRNMTAYLTSPGGFSSLSGNRGDLVVTTLNSGSDFPRFRATFKNMVYDGSGNSITFRAQYFVGEYVYGDANTVVHQAKNKEEDEEEDEADPATPYIIINQYSYGDDQIEAGTEFSLGMSFLNTSDDIPLENIVLKITTPDDLSIASASNSYYVDHLAAGAVLSQSIDLLAKPGATVGSHAVNINFTYEYIVDKTRKENSTDFSIAIPVTQIDRFSVDPLTEYEDYAMVGNEAYLTISFINRGKSTTYNISGVIQGELTSAGQSQHFGNLAPGESGSMDFSILCDEPGVLHGEVLLLYEDENTRQKEYRIPFSIEVEEESWPGYEEDPGDYGDPEPEGASTFTVVLCSLGGLLTAAPLALMIIKAMRAKGREELDEDF